MRGRAARGLGVKAGAVGTAVLAALEVGVVADVPRLAVGAVEEEGAFVSVTVAGEHEVNSVLLQQGKDDLPHLPHPRVAVLVLVRVVAAFRVGRVMAEGHEPVLFVGFEIGLEPADHQTVFAPITVAGIEAHEMNVRVVPRIIRLGAGHHAAGLRLRGQGEKIVIDAGLHGGTGAARVVIAEAWPEHGLAEHGVVGVEDSALILLLLAAAVSVVPEHQPEVSGAVTVPLIVGVAHAVLLLLARARIAKHPRPHRLRHTNGGMGDEESIRVRASESDVGGADGEMTRGLLGLAPHFTAIHRDDHVGRSDVQRAIAYREREETGHGADEQGAVRGVAPELAVRRRHREPPAFVGEDQGAVSHDSNFQIGLARADVERPVRDAHPRDVVREPHENGHVALANGVEVFRVRLEVGEQNDMIDQRAGRARLLAEPVG